MANLRKNKPRFFSPLPTNLASRVGSQAHKIINCLVKLANGINRGRKYGAQKVVFLNPNTITHSSEEIYSLTERGNIGHRRRTHWLLFESDLENSISTSNSCQPLKEIFCFPSTTFSINQELDTAVLSLIHDFFLAMERKDC